MWQVIVKNVEGSVCAKVPLDSGAVTIGRGRDCVIVLDSKLVSRLHGRLLEGGGRVLYQDEGSANGSTVNGQPARGAVQVNETSRIEIGEFRIELQQDAATAAPPPAQEVAGFRVTLPESPPAAPKPATPESPPTLSASMASLLDRQMSGIQSQRKEYEEGQRSERERFEQEWREAMTAAGELRKRVADHPRMRYFVIARDGRQVSAKISDSSKLGYCNLVLSRRHPENDAEIDGRVWYGESDIEPESYRSPTEALAELVRRIAAKLA
jgi:pSer/pThr/pTyr-binding forkhead associated (FHA) protein